MDNLTPLLECDVCCNELDTQKLNICYCGYKTCYQCVIHSKDMVCMKCRDSIMSSDILSVYVKDLRPLENSLIMRMFNPPRAVLEHYIHINKKNFTYMACPKKACAGKILISTNCCNVCKDKICLECWEPIEPGKHTCLKANILTVKTIMKSAKRCPFCQILIIKIDGCDDMVCANCNLGFCWRTLRSKEVNNHHYQNEKANAYYNFLADLKDDYQSIFFCKNPNNFFSPYFSRLNMLRLSSTEYETLGKLVCAFFTNDKTHQEKLFKLALRIFMLRHIFHIFRTADHDDILKILPKKFIWPALSSLELEYDKADNQWIFKDSMMLVYKWPNEICPRTNLRQDIIYTKYFFMSNINDLVRYVAAILDSDIKTIICDNHKALIKYIINNISNDRDITIIEVNSLFKQSNWHETQSLSIITDNDQEIVNPRYVQYFEQGKCLILCSSVGGYVPPMIFNNPNLIFGATTRKCYMYMKMNAFLAYLENKTFEIPTICPRSVVSEKVLSIFDSEQTRIFFKKIKKIGFVEFMNTYEIRDPRFITISLEAYKKNLTLFQTFVLLEQYFCS